MTGRRISRMLLISLLMSSVGLGGWSTPAPGLAQDTQDAADVEVSQELQEDVVDVSVFYEPLAPFGTWCRCQSMKQVWLPHGTFHDGALGVHLWLDMGLQIYRGAGPPFTGRWAFVASYGWVCCTGFACLPVALAPTPAPGW
jgi:hypothetical protein